MRNDSIPLPAYGVEVKENLEEGELEMGNLIEGVLRRLSQKKSNQRRRTQKKS